MSGFLWSPIEVTDETDRDVRGDPEDAIYENQASLSRDAPQGCGEMDYINNIGRRYSLLT
jgi:hypothetical protein